MKKLILSVFTVAIAGGFLIAQPVLTYENHRLLPGEDNPMTFCKYMDPGVGGENSTWDFAELEAIKEFSGQVINADKQHFKAANTQLVEFSTQFFFDIDESGIKQVGYASSDYKTIVNYDVPFDKMRYPFAYEDNYSTIFSGTYNYNGNKVGDVSGDGFVEADAYGKLILPNNSVYENTIRVKTEKNYSVKYSETSSNRIELVTYRWYNPKHRYPLCVLTKFTTISGDNENVNYQAAYNNNAVHSSSAVEVSALKDNVKLYPNPAKEVLYLSIYSENNEPALISIYDMSGRNMIEEKKNTLSNGLNTIDLSEELHLLSAGNYLLNIKKDNEVIVKEISVSSR